MAQFFTAEIEVTPSHRHDPLDETVVIQVRQAGGLVLLHEKPKLMQERWTHTTPQFIFSLAFIPCCNSLDLSLIKLQPVLQTNAK